MFSSIVTCNQTRYFTRRNLVSSIGRMLIGYMLFRTFVVCQAEAVPNSSALVASRRPHALCTADRLQNFLDQLDDVDEDEIEIIYEYCRDEFLQSHEISKSVRQAVDEWVRMDLSRAETNQIFLAYELALVGPKPERLPDGFDADCRRMVSQFEEFTHSLEPLVEYFKIDLGSLLESGSEEIAEQDRTLLNFVQYSQFCRSLLTKPDQNSSGTMKIRIDLEES